MPALRTVQPAADAAASASPPPGAAEPGGPSVGATDDGQAAGAVFSPFAQAQVAVLPTPHVELPAPDWSASVIALAAGMVCIARLLKALAD